MHALIQIFKVNEPRSGVNTKTGRAWSMQDAECALLSDDGAVSTVGVLLLPKTLSGDAAPKPGIYTGSFSLEANMERRIEARLTALTAVPQRSPASPSKG